MKKGKIVSLGFLIVIISLFIAQFATTIINTRVDYESEGEIVDVYVENNIAYLLYNKYGLSTKDELIIMSVSNPSNPIELSRFEADHPTEVYVDFPYAYIIDEGNFDIINVMNASNPFLVKEFDPGIEGIGGMEVIYPFAFLGIGSTKLSIINFSNILSPYEMSHIDLVGGARDIEVKTTKAYVAGTTGLKIVDISNFTNPTEIGVYYNYDGYDRCIVDGDVIYLVGWPDYIDIIDISNPSHPIKLSRFKENYGLVEGIFLYDDILYVAEFNGIALIDVSNPSKPIEVDKIYVNMAYDLYIEFPIAYVACDFMGFKIVNISNPSEWRNTPFIFNFIITIVGIASVATSISLKLLKRNKEVKR